MSNNSAAAIFIPLMQTEPAPHCQWWSRDGFAPPPSTAAQRGFALRQIASIFAFRQGLWNEGLRIPPGQECSNGSLILFAVVLWRIFC